ncbi:hypothetical protein ACE1OE_23630 [Vibrio sp. E150_011]
MNISFSLPHCFSILILSLSLVGCEHSDNGKSIENAETSTTSLLLTSTNGGSQGVGSWTTHDMTSLSFSESLVMSKGSPIPEGTVLDDGVSGTRAGFAFNSVDGLFYGIIPDRNRGEIVVFDPKNDTLARVVSIPSLYITGSAFPLSQYYTAPIISPDGKSLMLFAQSGGVPIPQPPGGDADRTVGALVHLNIDPISPNYGIFTPVYGMHEFGVTKTWEEQLNSVSMLPLLAETPEGDVVFLVTDPLVVEFGGMTYKNNSHAFSLTPSDSDDWSQVWGILGEVDDLTLGQEIASQAYYDNTRNKFWFSSQVRTGLGDTFVYRKDGPSGAAEFMPYTMTYGSIGASNPQAMVTQNGTAYMLTAGSAPLGVSVELDVAKFIEIPFTNSPIVRSELSSYWTGNNERLVPAGLATSSSTGFHFVNATSTADIDSLDDYILNEFWYNGVTSTSPFMDYDLDTLYAAAGILPSQLDRYDYNRFLRTNLFEGSTTDGYLIIGAPAIGGLDSEPMADRYVVSFAIHGGQNGYGSIIKYDRITGDTTSTALGNSTPGLPMGQPIQLRNGLILGGTSGRASAGLTPQLSEVGVWSLDLMSASPAILDYSLPKTDMQRNGGTWYTRAFSEPKRFTQTTDGSVWASVTYFVHDPFAFIVADSNYSTLVTGLVSFDPQTGSPTGELHLFGSSESRLGNSFTGVTSFENILSFTSPALRVEDSGANGQRLWMVDVTSGDNDSDFVNNFLLFSPEGNGDAREAWQAPFSATPDINTGDFYTMTTAVGDGVNQTSEVRIHKIQVESDTLALSLMTVVSGLIEQPNTPLFQASNGIFYYGTRSGKLMSFNSSSDIVSELADLTLTGMTTEIRGFLSESDTGVIIGIASDSSETQASTSRRAFSFNVSEQSLATVDVTDATSDQDTYPSIISIEY